MSLASLMACAEAVIDGQPAVLKKMYINASDGLTEPKVQHIEGYGKDMRPEGKLSEKLVPK